MVAKSPSEALESLGIEVRHIYCLIDPRTNLVRYVGCCTSPRNCRRRHQSIQKNTQPKLKAWVAELRAAGHKPIFKALQIVPFDGSRIIETNYIRSFHESVPGQLLNEKQLYSLTESSLIERIRNLRRIDRKNEIVARYLAKFPCP